MDQSQDPSPAENAAKSPNAKLTLLEQRTIEAKIAGPLIRAFCERFGREAALTVVEEVITKLAEASGAQLAEQLGSDDLKTFAAGLERWKEAGALEIVVLEETPSTLSFNVTRCRYAEMYRSLGLEDLGYSLSCRRDFALIEGFNPSTRLQRTQTLMQGAPYCDFRFRAEV